MARIKKEGEFINCKVRQDVVDRLNAYSEKSMIPKTSIVEKALEEYLDRMDDKINERQSADDAE